MRTQTRTLRPRKRVFPGPWQPHLALGLALLCSTPAHATPINVERLLGTGREAGWSGSYDGGVSWATGNVRRLEIRTGGMLRWSRFFPTDPDDTRTPFVRDRFVFISRLHFIRVNERDIVSQGHVHARYARMWWRRFGSEFFAQAQYNEITLLRSRVLGGGGLRVEASHHRNAGVWGGSGYMAEYELNATVPGDPHPRSIVNHRWTNYLTLQLRFAKERVLIQNTVYVQPRFDALDDVRILDAAQLEGVVTPIFSMGLEFNLQYDSRPPQTVLSTDITLGSYVKLGF